VAAAAAYSLLAWPVSVIAGLACQYAWHVLDGADGRLARLTGRSSPSGEVVDGLCDYLSQLAVYSALAFMLSESIGGWAWGLALMSGIARAVQANSYESRRRIYQYWVYGGSWLRQTLEKGDARPKGWLSVLARGYLSISDRVARPRPVLEQAMLARFRLGPEEEQAARSLYRDTQIGAIRAAGPLSANARTIAIALSMLAGSPIYFFVYEIVGLSLAMAWSLRVQAIADERLTRLLVGEDSGSVFKEPPQAPIGLTSEGSGSLPPSPAGRQA